MRFRCVGPMVIAGWLLACSADDRATPTSGAGGGGPSGTSTSAGPGSSSSTGGGGNGAAGGGAGWQTSADLLEPLQENAVVALDDEIYVIGGYGQADPVDRVEAYDPASDSWRSVAPLPSPRHHVNAAVLDGAIYVLGALVTNSFSAIGESLRYDPASDTWSSLASMDAGTERGGAAIGVIDTKIYVAGGYRQGSVADFAAYDTVLDTWETLPMLPDARDHLVGGVVDGVFYVIGGRSGGINGVAGRVDSFDPSMGMWVEETGMITARAGCAAAVLGTEIFVFGGEGNQDAQSGVFPQIEAYDTADDSWSSHGVMPTPRHGTGAAAVGGVLYVPGGADKQAFGAVAVHESFTP